MTIQLILPFPAAKLNPNKRKHWATKIDTKNSQRDEGYVAALPHKRNLPKRNYYPISLDFVPPDGRHRDLDNLLAASKQLLDGVAFGLGINDRQFGPITIGMKEPQKNNPHTVMEIIV